MNNPFIEDIKNQYKNGSVLIKLIFINLAVFLVVNLLGVALWLFNIIEGVNLIASWFSLPSNVSQIIMKPWTIVSYMFLHTGFLHLFSNMILLYFAGRLFVQYLGEKKLLVVYLLGGLLGGLLFIFFFNVFPVFNEIFLISTAMGASASVIAVLVAVTTHLPNYPIIIPFVQKEIKLKYITMVFVVLDLMNIQSQNSGGHIAHLGGALFGFMYIQQLKKGKDFTLGFSRFLDYVKALFTPRKKMKVVYKKPGKTKSNKAYNEQKVNNQKQVDAILDKISKSGYDSLTGQEKSILFDASKKS